MKSSVPGLCAAASPTQVSTWLGRLLHPVQAIHDGAALQRMAERSQPLTWQSVNYLIDVAAGQARLPGIRPHKLQHFCGFALANNAYGLSLIYDYLDCRDLRHTVHYTRTTGRHFEAAVAVEAEEVNGKGFDRADPSACGHPDIIVGVWRAAAFEGGPASAA